jgi:hypothetical protein
MTDLTAIDILVDPDDEAISRASVVNARLLQSIPVEGGGWVLDATHKPHITHLQRYVRTADLDQVNDAVEKTLGATDMSTLSYQAVKIVHADWGLGDFGPTVLLVQVNDGVLAFQAALEAAVAPHVESGGTGEAFVRDPGETIRPTIIDWVEKYVPDQIGDGKFLPHLTVGIAKFEDLKVIEAEPFDPITVHPASVSIYHLGNNGTARELLKTWPVSVT